MGGGVGVDVGVVGMGVDQSVDVIVGVDAGVRVGMGIVGVGVDIADVQVDVFDVDGFVVGLVVDAGADVGVDINIAGAHVNVLSVDVIVDVDEGVDDAEVYIADVPVDMSGVGVVVDVVGVGADAMLMCLQSNWKSWRRRTEPRRRLAKRSCGVSRRKGRGKVNTHTNGHSHCKTCWLCQQ